jgi:hypothetical protein
VVTGRRPGRAGSAGWMVLPVVQVRRSGKAYQVNLTNLSDAELSSLSAKVVAEQRRRGGLEFMLELPSTESGQGCTVQAGRRITGQEQS